MTPQANERQPDRRGRFWLRPVSRFARRPGLPAATPSRAELPPDEGEELLRRLREAGL